MSSVRLVAAVSRMETQRKALWAASEDASAGESVA